MTVANGSARAAGDQGQPGGILNSLRGIGPALLALLHTRVELLGVELAEEKARAASMAVLAGLAFLFGSMVLLMFNVLVLALFWDGHRYQAIVGLLVAHGAGAVACALRLKSQAASRPPIFEATIAEFKADLEALHRARQD